MALQLEADNHVALVHWWRDRDDPPATLVHVDLHHDLGYPEREALVGSGDVVRAGIREGRVRHVTWVVPFTRRALCGEVGDAVLATLPPDVRVLAAAPGRPRTQLDDAVIEVRGADDINDPAELPGPLELSVDLDFLYNPDVAGPTVEPVQFIERLLAWRQDAQPRATFLATGLGAGYSPPTYTPIAAWLSEALAGGAVPRASDELWRCVLQRERRRLGLVTGADDDTVLGRVWDAYLGRRWDELRSHLPQLAPPLRFHPREELLVEMQAGRPWPEEMRSRVEEATRELGADWRRREHG